MPNTLNVLNKKFIFINMLCVMSVMAVVLIIIFTYSKNNYTENTLRIMDNELMRFIENPNSNQLTEPENNIPDNISISADNFLPNISLKLEPSGNITAKNIRGLYLSEDELNKFLKLILAQNSGKSNAYGYIKNADLSYEIKSVKINNKAVYSQSSYADAQAAEASYIILAEVLYERRNIRNLTLICIFIFIITFAVFLFLSIRLAGWALAPVQQAWQQQKQFIADASHELRTPITVILANLDILKRSTDEAERTKWLKNTEEEALGMKELAQNLLFLARADAQENLKVAQNAENSHSEVDLSHCLTDRVLSFEVVAFERNISIESNIAPELRIYGDEALLKQLFSIFLDNACKYTDSEGKITVSAYSSKNKVFVEINNEGTPIPKQELEHIFKRFYRADKARTKEKGGYGLGLSIAASIVRQFKGSIRAESNKKEGTTFTIIF